MTFIVNAEKLLATFEKKHPNKTKEHQNNINNIKEHIAKLKYPFEKASFSDREVLLSLLYDLVSIKTKIKESSVFSSINPLIKLCTNLINQITTEINDHFTVKEIEDVKKLYQFIQDRSPYEYSSTDIEKK